MWDISCPLKNDVEDFTSFSRIFVRPAVSLANRLRVGTPNHQTSVGTPVRPTWGGANGLHVHKVHDHIRRRPQKRNDETRRGEDI